MTWNKDRAIKIMGIINLTPDSFHAPSRYNLSIFDSGADIIDIGACSTRPGSTPVSEEEEWRRLEPVLWDISRHHSGTFSLDTFRPGIVRKAYRYLGQFIVNDVSGAADPLMLPTVAELGLPYIYMHNGPADDIQPIIKYFEEFAPRAEAMGIQDWYVDPGFGFGKDVEQNLRILDGLGELKRFARPVLVGISRKRMSWERENGSPESALARTSELHLKALRAGADVLRVHDVAEARKVIELYRSNSQE